MTAARTRRLSALLAAVLLQTVLAAPAVAGDDGATAMTPMPLGDGDARALLTAVAGAVDTAHVGSVSVVTFTPAGPRVADLDVRVGAVGDVELRRPTRLLLGAPGGGWLRTEAGATAVTPATAALGLDVDALLDRWDAHVGPPRTLDTGVATPVHLVRADGAVEEVLYVDEATGIPVRRETRARDGRVLRVVAYTSLTPVRLPGPGAVATPVGLAEAVPDPAALAALRDEGYLVPDELGAGFRLLAVDHRSGRATARYGDGLSVLSVYQHHGALDPVELHGASIVHVADRDVWAWPGAEPLRLVWTDGDRTWTVVSDAPIEAVESAVAALPGTMVGHDVPSRIRRGLDRAWRWLLDRVG